MVARSSSSNPSVSSSWRRRTRVTARPRISSPRGVSEKRIPRASSGLASRRRKPAASMRRSIPDAADLATSSTEATSVIEQPGCFAM